MAATDAGARYDRGVPVAWLGELGLRFWCISPTAGLEENAAEALPRLPHGQIVLARETPGSRARLTVAIEKAKSTAIHRRFTKQGH